jgi:hypothetical protein
LPLNSGQTIFFGKLFRSVLHSNFILDTKVIIVFYIIFFGFCGNLRNETWENLTSKWLIHKKIMVLAVVKQESGIMLSLNK